MADLLSGQLQVYIGAMTSSLEYVKAGRLHALAVSTATRSDALPEVARVSDFVPGFETSDWGGVSAPKSTPAEITDKLNKEINAAFADSKIKARLTDLGATPLPGSPAEFGNFIVAETEKWAKVVKPPASSRSDRASAQNSIVRYADGSPSKLFHNFPAPRKPAYSLMGAHRLPIRGSPACVRSGRARDRSEIVEAKKRRRGVK
jgi:hypothetical protein